MRSYSAALIFLISVGVAAAALYHEIQEYEGEEPYCMDKVHGKKKVGDVWYTSDCLRKTCSGATSISKNLLMVEGEEPVTTSVKGTVEIETASCGVASYVKNGVPCRLVPGEGDYPACCPRPAPDC